MAMHDVTDDQNGVIHDMYFFMVDWKNLYSNFGAAQESLDLEVKQYH